MQTIPIPAASIVSRPRQRTALIVSGDCCFRQRLNELLTGLRWQVRVADSGAQAWEEADRATPEAVIVDTWLPDLDWSEFLEDFRNCFPETEVVTAGGNCADESPRGPHRNELLYAVRKVQDSDTAAWNTAPALQSVNEKEESVSCLGPVQPRLVYRTAKVSITESSQVKAAPEADETLPPTLHAPFTPGKAVSSSERIPELIGNAPCMLEVSRRIRLVASRSTPVLIEGPTGSGKEVVAQALHRLSPRNRRPLVVINCAAIPESLLEAELFGHTRGAFTGAVQGREGRIEAADGGTLFLDEIGEMPLALQAKLLRFLENGELQRVGDNETVRVDVRIVAATHCPLAELTREGKFRSDLYYRLAVFLVRTPALTEHMEDLSLLVEHGLERLGRDAPVKRVSAEAMNVLARHNWPGNVRELEHVLERAAILAGDEPVLTAQEIDFGGVAG